MACTRSPIPYLFPLSHVRRQPYTTIFLFRINSWNFHSTAIFYYTRHIGGCTAPLGERTELRFIYKKRAAYSIFSVRLKKERKITLWYVATQQKCQSVISRIE